MIGGNLVFEILTLRMEIQVRKEEVMMRMEILVRKKEVKVKDRMMKMKTLAFLVLLLEKGKAGRYVPEMKWQTV